MELRWSISKLLKPLSNKNTILHGGRWQLLGIELKVVTNDVEIVPMKPCPMSGCIQYYEGNHKQIKIKSTSN